MTRFGAFEFDPVRHQLRRDGAPVHVEPKAFELLSLLLAAAPRVLSKAELHDRLWPRGVVADATLVALVKELRRALGDRDRRTPLIRTVHRVGYAFEAPIERVESPRPAPALHWLVAPDRRMPLADGENVVGRDARSAVWIDDPTVSRSHARIVISDGNAHVEDLDSKNGTSVGGVTLTRAVNLRDGDRVAFGQVHLIYRRSGGGPATVTHVGRAARSTPGH